MELLNKVKKSETVGNSAYLILWSLLLEKNNNKIFEMTNEKRKIKHYFFIFTAAVKHCNVKIYVLANPFEKH